MESYRDFDHDVRAKLRDISVALNALYGQMDSTFFNNNYIQLHSVRALIGEAERLLDDIVAKNNRDTRQRLYEYKTEIRDKHIQYETAARSKK